MHHLNNEPNPSGNSPFANAGYVINLAIATDHSEEIIFGRPSSTGETLELFSVLIRPGGTYIWIHGGEGLYRVGRSERLWELTEELLRVLEESAPHSDLQLEGFFCKYRMRRVEIRELFEEARVHALELHGDMGWRYLAKDENERLWHAATERLYSASAPDAVSRITPPAPWIRWLLPDQIKEWRFDAVTHRIRDLYRQFHLAVLTCLRSNVRRGELVYSLNFNHQGYAFDPANENAELYVQWWPTSPIPDGEYILFADAEFEVGMFTAAVEPTIWAFGRSFAQSFDEAISPYARSFLTELGRSGNDDETPTANST